MQLSSNAQVFVPKSSAPLQIQGDLLIAQLADMMGPTPSETPSEEACPSEPSAALPAPLRAPSTCLFPASGIFCPTCIDGLACGFHMTNVARCSPEVYQWLHSSFAEGSTVKHDEVIESRDRKNSVCRQIQAPPPPPPPPLSHLCASRINGKTSVPKWQDDTDASTNEGGSERGYAGSEASESGSSPLMASTKAVDQAQQMWLQQESEWLC